MIATWLERTSASSFLVGVVLVIGFVDDARSEEPSTWVTVSPRTWMSQIQTSDSSSLIAGGIFIPMFGGSLAVTPPMLPRVSLVVTALYGKGDSSARFTTVAGGERRVVKSDLDAERYDVEALLRYQLSRLPIYVFLGGRFVRFEQEIDGDGAVLGHVSIDSDSDLWILKGGVGAASALDERGKHRLFANAAVGVGFSDIETDVRIDAGSIRTSQSADDEVPTLDINAGYQHSFNSWLAFEFRYRSNWVFRDDEFDQLSTNFAHGPELSFSASF